MLYWIDVSFSALFSIELMLKMIALGLFRPPNAYLRSAWNCLDAFVVVSAIVDILISDVYELGFVKVRTCYTSCDLGQCA